jgi:hypothetical protein
MSYPQGRPRRPSESLRSARERAFTDLGTDHVTVPGRAGAKSHFFLPGRGSGSEMPSWPSIGNRTAAGWEGKRHRLPYPERVGDFEPPRYQSTAERRRPPVAVPCWPKMERWSVMRPAAKGNRHQERPFPGQFPFTVRAEYFRVSEPFGPKSLPRPIGAAMSWSPGQGGILMRRYRFTRQVRSAQSARHHPHRLNPSRLGSRFVGNDHSWPR